MPSERTPRIRVLLARLNATLHRRRTDDDMSREIAAHLALIEDDLRRAGMSDAEARLAARRVYGGVEQSKELHRDERSFVWLEQFLQDLRHAFRSLAKSPGFVAVAVVSLAFGIGVNTAIFTLVNGILLKTLPVPDPYRIVQPEAHLKELDSHGFSFPVFRALRRQNAIFADVIGFSPRPAIVEWNGEPHRLDFELVTGSYFAFFGARPALGRLLDEEDDRVDGAHPVCVLSYRAWRGQFGGDPGVLGRSLRIDGIPLQVVGVAPPDFVGAELQKRFDIWAPTALSASFTRSPRESPNYIWLHLLARLKPDLSFAQANARLSAASRGIEDGLPADRANANAVYRLLDGSKGFDDWRNTLHDPLIMLMTAVTLVLLVACANLANLVLARARERAREFAVKLSLGISRSRLLRQLLLESFVLALGGGLAAILLSFVLTSILLSLYNAGSHSLTLHVEPDLRVLLYALGTCLATALAAGLYPAWQASRTDAGAGLKGGVSLFARRGAARRSLILVQVTLAVVLLFGASLFAHSLRNLKTIDLGYDIDHVLTVQFGQRGSGPPVAGSPVLASVLERVRSLPGVESAALANPGVLTGGVMIGTLLVPDAAGGSRKVSGVYLMYAGADYFSTLRTPLLRGRDFTAADRTGPPVVIVNQRLAALACPGRDPIGRHFDFWGTKNLEIIGVTANSRYQGVREDTRAIAYRMFDQAPLAGGVLEIRTRGPMPSVERDVRRIIRTMAPDYQVSNAASMELLRDNLIAQDRLLAFLSSLFGALGTLLALVGIYGLISYSVARRTREIGIRVSVGAQGIDVLWMFIRESLVLVAAGLLLGLPLAVALARFLRAMLYQVPTSDPLGIAATLILILLGGALASIIPAARAARTDPVRALRYE